jgi:hypothetical protein
VHLNLDHCMCKIFQMRHKLTRIHLYPHCSSATSLTATAYTILLTLILLTWSIGWAPIMPANGRWDLTRRLKGSECWTCSALIFLRKKKKKKTWIHV